MLLFADNSTDIKRPFFLIFFGGWGTVLGVDSYNIEILLLGSLHSSGSCDIHDRWCLENYIPDDHVV